MTNHNMKSKYELKNQFFKSINEPLQTPCKILKKIGGRWNDSPCGAIIGEKMICMDFLYKALNNGSCLIYSFGLADDWDFEIKMADLGTNNIFMHKKDCPNLFHKLP